MRRLHERSYMSDEAGKNEFAGVPVVVVGAHAGTGPSVVRAFVTQGARVAAGVIGDAGSAAPLDGAVNIAANLGNTDSVRTFFDACEKALDGLSVVVLVAPPVKTKSALDFTESEYRSVIESELMAPILCMQEAARRLVAKGGGRIISFASMSAKTGVHKNVAPYAAAKGGLITFSRVLAAELAHTGVTVNVIATALMDVQVAKKSADELAEIVKGIPVGRVGHSDEAAHAVLFLASEKAGYVTGETLSLSGGRFMD